MSFEFGGLHSAQTKHRNLSAAEASSCWQCISLSALCKGICQRHTFGRGHRYHPNPNCVLPQLYGFAEAHVPIAL